MTFTAKCTSLFFLTLQGSCKWVTIQAVVKSSHTTCLPAEVHFICDVNMLDKPPTFYYLPAEYVPSGGGKAKDEHNFRDIKSFFGSDDEVPALFREFLIAMAIVTFTHL